MLDESIKRLGSWTSNAFKLYFTTTPYTLFNLNLIFRKGRPLAVPRATLQGPTVTAMRGPKPWRQVSLKSWKGGVVVLTILLRQPSLKNFTTNHRQYLFGHSLLSRIVSQARPLGLRAPPCVTAPLQSICLKEHSSFPEGLLAPLSLAITSRNLKSLALGALLDSILLVPQFIQKCNKIQNLKVQLFRPLGENLSPKLNPRERWIEIIKDGSTVVNVNQLNMRHNMIRILTLTISRLVTTWLIYHNHQSKWFQIFQI